MLLASIDQRLRSVRALFRWILCRVEPSAPSVAQDIDVIDRIAPAAHRPDDLIHIGRVDVFIDSDDPLGVVSTARYLRRQCERLRGVPGITLLEGNDRHAKSAGSGRMRIDALDSRYPELFQIIPDAS